MSPQARRLLRATLSLLPPLAALIVQWLLWSLIQPYVWFLFYPAVFASSWIGGMAAGLRATALSVALVWWFFLPPEHSFLKHDLKYLFPVAVFIGMGILFSLFHERLRRSERRFRELFDQASDGVFVADLEGRYTDVNDAGCRLLGLTRDEIVGKTILDFIPAADVDRLWQAKARLLQGGVHIAEWSLRRKDGSYVPVEVSAKILPDGRWQGFVRDIGERKRMESKLRKAAIVLESTNEGIMVTDAERRIVTVNGAFTTITGYAADEVLGRDPRLLQSGRHDEDFYRALWAVLERTGQWQGEIWNRRKNGEVFPAWENISAVKDPHGAVTHYVSVLSDISAIKGAEERLSHLAHHDALTGLPNRLLFTASLEKSLERARRHGQKVALLFVDLDRFKLINDTMGHAAGDQLLQEVGRRLQASVRAEDTVARLGGDEFTVVFEEILHTEEIADLTEKILAEIARPVVLAGKEVVTSGSIGIAIYPDDAATAEDLTKAADAAMYRAKERGRHTCEFYTPEITARALEYLSIENGLRRALTHGELALYYQPQHELGSGRITGVEALLRWHHPDEGLVLPGRFIPVAEESGLITAIGDWVIREALAQRRAWLARGIPPLRIAINVSGRQILHDHLVETMQSALHDSGLKPGDALIELEVTESVLQSMERSADVLRRLRALGMRIAIDDFGTGYSSLSLLKHLPIDTLKIDGVFVRHIPDDADSRAIAAAMVSMAHALGLRVIAEGVETEGQLEFLHDQGCDEVQGYLLGMAVPAEEIAASLVGARSNRCHSN